MDSTETTPAPALGGRQVGQVLAERYRLGLFKGGDDLADVWHALDDSTEKVVTLEILRDRDNEAARQRFLAEARRMAAIERPSVMRVAAIHDDATATFIVFEHLIPLPVVLTGLSAIARDVKPATRAAEAKTVVLTAAVPPVPVSVAPPTLAAVVGPMRSAAALESAEDDATTSTIIELDTPVASAARTAATVSPVVSGLVAGATQVAADARLLFRDMRPGTLVVAARALMPQRIDTSMVTSLVARVTARARQLASGVSGARASLTRAAAPAKGDAADTAAASSYAAYAGAALASIMSLGMRAASSAAPLIARARGNPAVLASATGILVLAVFVASPLDDAIANALRSTAAPSPTAAPRAALAPAAFDVPPLSAYGAAFESQGAYPTTSPNGTVEWVVALRNTGSAGWYRGIEGAQAALALPDGAGVAVQSTDYVAPGQVGWFVVHFRAHAELGTYTVQLLPRIDGRGPLQDLGIFTVVTVSKNP
jgi:hypothetical protein